MVLCRLVSRCRSDTNDCSTARGCQLQEMINPGERVEGVSIKGLRTVRGCTNAKELGLALSMYQGSL